MKALYGKENSTAVRRDAAYFETVGSLNRVAFVSLLRRRGVRDSLFLSPNFLGVRESAVCANYDLQCLLLAVENSRLKNFGYVSVCVVVYPAGR